MICPAIDVAERFSAMDEDAVNASDMVDVLRLERDGIGAFYEGVLFVAALKGGFEEHFRRVGAIMDNGERGSELGDFLTRTPFLGKWWLYGFHLRSQWSMCFQDPKLRALLGELGAQALLLSVPRAQVRLGRYQCIFHADYATRVGSFCPTLIS